MEQVDQSIAGYLKFHLITIGVNNGLFDALQKKLSSAELATATKCDERYVREWCQGNFHKKCSNLRVRAFLYIDHFHIFDLFCTSTQRIKFYLDFTST